MKNLSHTKALLVLALVSTAGCADKLKTQSASEMDPHEAAIESAVTTVDGMADDQDGGSFASYRTEKSNRYDAIAALLRGQQAQAAGGCGRAVFQACVNGVKSIEYDSCEINGTRFVLDGSVNLTYSDLSCALSATGDSVTRTFRTKITGPRGGSVEHFSSERDVRLANGPVGGGGKLTKSATGWSVDVLGHHAVGTLPNGRPLFDVSLKTAAPLQVSGSLARAGRIVDGGQLDVYHNLAGFKASFVPSQLQYSNTCCHPVSGSLSITYTGSITGSAVVTFNGCGDASLNRAGSVRRFLLSYCQ